MKKRIVAILLAMSMLLVMTACGGSETEASVAGSNVADVSAAQSSVAAPEGGEEAAPDAPAPAEDAGEPQYGGIVRLASDRTVAGVNPGYTPVNSANGHIITMCCAYESLTTYDEAGAIVPLLATEWTTDTEEPSITWTLREGVTFADGEPFNAAAVQRNIEEYQKNNRTETAIISECEIIDDYTIKMKLSSWSSSAVESIGFFVYYMAPDKIEELETKGDFSCGTGPFQVSEYESGVMIKYAKNENYWQEGKPYLDGVEIRQVNEASTLASSFQANELDLIQMSDLSLAQQLSTNNAYIMETNVTGVGLNAVGICPNSADENSPLAKTEVRQAICYAIDSEALATAFGYGMLKSTNQWAVEGSATYNPEVQGYPYDPEKAVALLKEAGYENGFDTVINCDAGYKDAFTAIGNMLEEVGIHCEINILDTPSMAGMWMSGEWEGMIQHVFAISPDLGLYMGRHLALDGTFITKGIQHPQEAMELLEAIRSAKTDEEKLDLEMQMQKVIYDDYALFGKPMFVDCAPVFKNASVHDDFFTVNHYTTWTPSDCWIG